MSCRLLLCTDLDRTLIPNGSQPESPGARDLFARLASRPEVMLAYVSGRDAARIGRAIEEFDLPLPQHVVADVGTSIFDIDSTGQWVENLDWDREIRQDWGEQGRDSLTRLLAEFSELRVQERSKQSRLKLSFYVSTRIDAADLIKKIQMRISSHEIPVTLVYSLDEGHNIGLLDVLPERANKLHAIKFMIEQSEFDISRTVFCGDSGNDLSVLASEIPGVLVANASEDVQRQALQLSECGGYPDRIYVARGEFLGMNGNYSAGILEGVHHFFPDCMQLIADR